MTGILFCILCFIALAAGQNPLAAKFLPVIILGVCAGPFMMFFIWTRLSSV